MNPTKTIMNDKSWDGLDPHLYINKNEKQKKEATVHLFHIFQTSIIDSDFYVK